MSVDSGFSIDQNQLKVLADLAEQLNSTASETLDAALESLRKKLFFEAMAKAESEMKSNPDAWSDYIEERDTWLNADLGTP